MNVQRCYVSPGVWFGSARVAIGEGTFVNYGCMFNTSAQISLGARCDVGMQVTFATSSHQIGTEARRAGPATAAPIVVGDGAWIGARVVVLGGVHIGAGAVIAAGAVVTKDCEENSLYAGVPARKIKILGTQQFDAVGTWS